MGLLGFPLGPTEQTLRMISAGSQSYEGFVAVSGGAGFCWRGAEGWRCGACGETPLPGVGMNGHDKVLDTMVCQALPLELLFITNLFKFYLHQYDKR